MNIATLFQTLVVILWLATLGMLILAVTRASRGRPVRNATGIIVFIGLVSLVMTILSQGLVFINPQERGVVISAFSPKGYRDAALQPGLRWVIPFAETVVRYPISRETYTMSIATSEGQLQGDDSITARTADGQQIFVDASVIYAIDPAKVVQVHINWQDRYNDNLVRPQARGIIRDVVSQFGVQDVVSSKRSDMVKTIADRLSQKLSDNGLVMVDFVLRNITFSPEYAASVEQKQIAEQRAQEAKLTVEQKRQEAEQARQTAQGAADANVIRAKGDAEARLVEAEAEAKALTLIAEALKNKPELLTYQYITKIAPNVQVMYLPSNSPFVFSLPQYGPSASTTTTTPTTP